MAYPGGKGAQFRQIVNRMPPHEVYIEAFLGGGAVGKAKRSARRNVGIEVDPSVLAVTAGELGPGWELVNGDALEWLGSYRWQGGELVYCDPPYLLGTRSSGREIYAHEFCAMQEHEALLRLLLRLPCMVMVSGYWSDLYGDALRGWSVASWQARTRGGRNATEFLWYNFPDPVALHDYRYLGDNYRERERIKRRQKRWTERLGRMDVQERRALLAAIAEAWL